MARRLVVVGGDAAGMSAAAQARRRARPDELEIVAFERGDFTSYSACGLPYFVAGEVERSDSLIARSPEEFRAVDIDVELGCEAVAIDTAAQAIEVRDLDSGAVRNEPYDDLVIGTGATPVRPALAGADAHGVHGIQTIGDGLALRAHIDAHPGDKRAVVVGSGYVGLEMAEALKTRGFEVTVVDRAPQPMKTLDPDMGALVADAMRGLGITVRSGESVTGFEVADGHVSAVVTETATLPADVVVLGLGVRPNSELAAQAGIEVGASGGIAVSARMETSAPHVWAAGDCVEVWDRIARRFTTVSLGTHANKQGRVVGLNVTGGDLEFPGVVGTAVTKVCAYEIARAGLRAGDCDELGIDYAQARIESTSRAGYYPGAAPITVKMLVEKGTGGILGAQIVGREGAAKRIDVVAMALWNGMTAAELSQTDLGYAPPFSPVWDPVLIAARKLADV